MEFRSVALSMLYTNAAAKEDNREMTPKMMLTLSDKYDEEANNLIDEREISSECDFMVKLIEAADAN